MTPEFLSAIVLGSFGLIGAVVQTLRSRGLSWHQTVREELQILHQLSRTSGARSALEQHVERRILEYTQGVSVKSRDWAGIVIAVALLLIALGFAVGAVRFGGWWNLLWLPSASVGLFGAVGLASSAPKRERDEKGNAISSAQRP